MLVRCEPSEHVKTVVFCPSHVLMWCQSFHHAISSQSRHERLDDLRHQRLIQTACPGLVFWNSWTGFTSWMRGDGSVSLVLSHPCLPASWLIHFNLPSLAQNTTRCHPSGRAGSGTNWILMANLHWKPLMRWFLNLPAWNNDDRRSTKQENIRPALQVGTGTGAGHKHAETRGGNAPWNEILSGVFGGGFSISHSAVTPTWRPPLAAPRHCHSHAHLLLLG